MRAVGLAIVVSLSIASSGVKTDKQPVEVEMRNVGLHLTPDISVQIHHLRGRFVAEGARQIPYLDDPTSYSVTIDTGEVAIDLASLNAMMTRTLQGHSNVSGLKITIDEGGRLRQKGTVKKGIPVPFDVKAQASVTPDGKIRVHSESVKGFGVPVNPLLKAFGIEMDDLLKVDPGRGISVQGNDLILDPTRLLPPPAMHGTITAVRIEHNAMVQTFGSGAPRPLSPPATSKNFIYWRGGQLTFGKLTMTETDLELIDDDPKDPFDFSVDRWNDALTAGYSKVTPARGLKAHMPDYNDLSPDQKSKDKGHK
ncbi:MAG TPA: hypothetical protein VKB50_15740 [Vicinamibacterales bacterium]|nr:hypothetical protein [Vicinamibacterales bacterium]